MGFGTVLVFGTHVWRDWLWGVIRVLGLCLDIEWSERLVVDITKDALELIGSSHEDLNDAVTSAIIKSHIAFPPCSYGV